MPRLHDAPTALRKAARVALSSYVTNGFATALGIPLVAAIVGGFLGPLAAATAAVGVIVMTPPDQVSPRRGKLAQLVPAAVFGVPLFWAVQELRADALWLTVLLVVASFVAFLGAAWGKRGLPVSIAVMFSMIFALAVPQQEGPRAEFDATLAFAIGMALYLAYSVAINALLNPRYRTLALVDSLLLVSRLMRTQAR